MHPPGDEGRRVRRTSFASRCSVLTRDSGRMKPVRSPSLPTAGKMNGGGMGPNRTGLSRSAMPHKVARRARARHCSCPGHRRHCRNSPMSSIRISDWMPDESGIVDRVRSFQSPFFCVRLGLRCALCLACEQSDSNPHEQGSLPSEDSGSTGFAVLAGGRYPGREDWGDSRPGLARG